jgi:hypothetical protein
VQSEASPARVRKQSEMPRMCVTCHKLPSPPSSSSHSLLYHYIPKTPRRFLCRRRGVDRRWSLCIITDSPPPRCFDFDR